MGTDIVFLVLKQLELGISLDEVCGYNICKPCKYKNAKTSLNLPASPSASKEFAQKWAPGQSRIERIFDSDRRVEGQCFCSMPELRAECKKQQPSFRKCSSDNTFPKNVMVKIERNIQLAKESGKYKTKQCIHGNNCKFGDKLCIFSHHGAERLPF